MLYNVSFLQQLIYINESKLIGRYAQVPLKAWKENVIEHESSNIFSMTHGSTIYSLFDTQACTNQVYPNLNTMLPIPC